MSDANFLKCSRCRLRHKENNWKKYCFIIHHLSAFICLLHYNKCFTHLHTVSYGDIVCTKPDKKQHAYSYNLIWSVNITGHFFNWWRQNTSKRDIMALYFMSDQAVPGMHQLRNTFFCGDTLLRILISNLIVAYFKLLI